MKHLISTLGILTLLFISTGCDSTTPTSDTDRVVGVWEAVGIADTNQDYTALLLDDFHQVTFTFADEGAFVWNQDGVDDIDDEIIQGTYSVREADDELNITLADPSGFQFPLPFTYSFSDDNTLLLRLPAARFNELTGDNFAGTMQFTFQRL